MTTLGTPSKKDQEKPETQPSNEPQFNWTGLPLRAQFLILKHLVALRGSTRGLAEVCQVWRQLLSPCRQNEFRNLPCLRDVFLNQAEITPEMRKIMVAWLVEVQQEYQLQNTTLFLCVNYLDRFLAIRRVPKHMLQLLGAACLWVASKIEETEAPNIEDFVYICDDAYSSEKLLMMESTLLNVLDFDLNSETIHHFLSKFLVSWQPSPAITKRAQYLAEIALLANIHGQYYPSTIAAAAIFLTMRTLGYPISEYDSAIFAVTGYRRQMPEIASCMDTLNRTHEGLADAPVGLQSIPIKHGFIKTVQAEDRDH